MKKKMRDFKPGEIIVLTSGEYSDFSITAVFKVLKPFNFADELKKYTKIGDLPGYIVSKLIYTRDSFNIANKLVIAGLWEELKHLEAHVGSYGEYDPTISE